MLRLKSDAKKIYYWTFQSNGLTVHVASSVIGVVRVKVRFTRDENFLNELKNIASEAEFVEDFAHNELVVKAIKGYLRGSNLFIDLPWNIESTPFIYNVWKSVCKIPYGDTRSYSHIASVVGKPRGARAVGQAVKKNPLLIIIPCHRVVSINSLGGFSAGIELKRYLLNLEKS